MLTPEVEQGIAELRASFSQHTIDVKEDGQGGAHVTVRPIDIGPKFKPSAVWIAFHLGIHYPTADVYPHFFTVVTRTDGSALPGGLSLAKWLDDDATQASRKTNERVDGVDNAAKKLWKVIAWLRGL